MIIRKINLKNLTPEGIPQDSKDVMEYFNEDLESESLPKWTARKTPITIDEIKNLWMPSMKQNITLLAEDKSKIIGSLTVFYKKDATEYEHKHVRKEGALSITINSKYDYKEIAKLLIIEAIKELKKQNKTAYATGAKESPSKQIFGELGYTLTKEISEIPKINKLSGKLFTCHLP